MSKKENKKGEHNKIRFAVSGMHCSSCEALIEERVSRLPGVKSVSVSRGDGSLEVGLAEGAKIDASKINDLFPEDDYSFSSDLNAVQKPKDAALIVLLFGAAVAAALVAFKSQAPAIDATNSLMSFAGFGLAAGFSTCAALVGGLLLSVSKRWAGAFSGSSAVLPGALFNVGRLLGFALFGGFLGFLGNRIAGLTGAAPYVSIAVSLVIAASALRIAGVSLPLPKLKIARRIIASEAKSGISRYEPAALGALSFFIPCGFTAAAQAAAIGSADPFRGASIMFFFALGTLLPLLAIGAFGQKVFGGKGFSGIFSKATAALLIVFASWNATAQFNLIRAETSASFAGDVRPTGKTEVIKTEVGRNGYSPNVLKVSSGSNVRWEIKNASGTGCTSSMVAPGIFKGTLNIPLGRTVVKEFVAPEPGVYRFSCWMGMYSGTIKVI